MFAATVRGADDAAAILAAAGIKGGLIVHLGCGDGKLTAALRANESFVVHGLDAEVTAARKHVRSLGLYGPVSVEKWTGARLPYADNLANLVVSSVEGGVSREEIERVLAPGGSAIFLSPRPAPRPSFRKARPPDIDEWTHYLHDAGNNAVAKDSRVGTPRSLQWAAPPLWLRSHETPSGVEALVCGGGRLFYIFDEGIVGITDQRLPERWALLCRDAFNGKLLWRRPLEAWGWPQWATEKFGDKELWQAEPQVKNLQTLVAYDGVVVMRNTNELAAWDGASGRLLWQHSIPPSIGIAEQDLFVINGVVWPGVTGVDENRKPARKATDVMAVGYDLRTGAECKRASAASLLSPEHHHRCYRNKATSRYLITSMEGAEFLDIEGANHTQNNFLRGACKLGMMPCNGMLYVPSDQCFCQPGAKLLGFTAVAPAVADAPVPAAQRLERGPAFAEIQNLKSEIRNPNDWPTFRHDAARHGTTTAEVGSAVSEIWRARLTGVLTAPVAVGERVYVAARDAHTVHALDLATGKPAWSFVAGGRIDSPPTVWQSLLLFGSADGWVYCLRADDGALVWRFLAAPAERRILCFDQLESAWPAHGSVLMHEGLAYVTAGRSTYLDGGIRVYALEPQSGKILYQTVLAGPFPDGGKTVPRDVSFAIPGANSDVLVSEGDALYMRQKRLTPALQEVKVASLSSKLEADVGGHVFSTAGLLDDSWYNRAFWMYAKRWPGFQLANQSSKSGQLLVVDAERTYAVQPFYRRNVHSPMFFPGKEGYLLFADANGNEPQIVGDTNATTPVAWLPQSDYGASTGLRKLDSNAFGSDKGIGYTRAAPPLWKTWLPVRIRAMVKAGDTLFVAGPPDEFDAKDPYAPFEGRRGARLVAVSAKDGHSLSERSLDAPPVFDAMIAVSGRLLVSLEDGSLLCLAGKP
jgi:outer membrane protein assembly factor BamB